MARKKKRKRIIKNKKRKPNKSRGKARLKTRGVKKRKNLTLSKKFAAYPIFVPFDIEEKIHKEILRVDYETTHRCTYDTETIYHAIYMYLMKILESLKNEKVFNIHGFGKFYVEKKDITVNGETIKDQLVPYFKASPAMIRKIKKDQNIEKTKTETKKKERIKKLDIFNEFFDRDKR